jgi:penicillin G amidase
VLFTTPLLRAINLTIAGLLIVLVALVYWFGWRSLPQTSGTITAPISARATIARDARGIPHITAGSWQDALFLQGYATAQDRLWQMDALRRMAAGQLAEVVGKAAFESDREHKSLQIERIAEAEERNLTPEAQAIFAAYARGVNYFLETHRGRLPPEFALLNYQPRPWLIRDSLLAAIEMYRTLTSTWREEMNKVHMLEGGDPAKVNFLYPLRGISQIQPGSNAWVISGAHSANGKPLLANDPHLQWSLPSVWHLVHLRAPALDVAGAALPGIPAVIIGHNRRIAWGVTNLGFSVQDLYREQIDIATGRYLFEGKTEQARLDRDVIVVKGEKPMTMASWVTQHGPVFLTDRNQSFSLRWTDADAIPLDFPFLDLDRAANWQQFNAALARFPGPAQNFVYADVDGNIGYHAAGRLPIRARDCATDLPLDGSSGQCEWKGIISYDQLPQVFNPPSGIINTSNQDPFPRDYPYPVTGRFAPKYRGQEVRALLRSHEKWQPAQMLAVQKDVYSEFSKFLAQQVVAAWDKHPEQDSRAGDAVQLLRSWNGQMEKGTAAPMLISLIFDEVRKSVGNRASPGHGDIYQTSFMAPEVIERLLRDRPSGWFPDYDALLRKCLAAAIQDGEMVQGSKVSRWDYGQFNELTIQNPVVGQLPLIGTYFDIGPVPMSGSSTTIKQTTGRIGPSMRMVVDLGDFDKSLENLTIGESGHPLSRHYKDQWNAYYAGRSFPMEFDKVDSGHVLTVNPQVSSR